MKLRALSCFVLLVCTVLFSHSQVFAQDAPPNDDVGGAVLFLDSDGEIGHEVSMDGATQNFSSDPFSSCFFENSNVYYIYVNESSEDQAVVIDTTTSDFDTGISVYELGEFGTEAEVVCVDNEGVADAAFFYADAASEEEGPTTYLIKIADLGSLFNRKGASTKTLRVNAITEQANDSIRCYLFAENGNLRPVGSQVRISTALAPRLPSTVTETSSDFEPYVEFEGFDYTMTVRVTGANEQTFVTNQTTGGTDFEYVGENSGQDEISVTFDGTFRDRPFQITCTASVSWTPGPDNDNLDGARELTKDDSLSQDVSLSSVTEAELNVFAPECLGGGFSQPNFNRTVWYKYTHPAGSETAKITVDTNGSRYDTILQVFNMPALIGGVVFSKIACNDDVESGFSVDENAVVCFAAQPGQTYFVQVGAKFSDEEDYDLKISLSCDEIEEIVCAVVANPDRRQSGTSVNTGDIFIGLTEAGSGLPVVNKDIQVKVASGPNFSFFSVTLTTDSSGTAIFNYNTFGDSGVDIIEVMNVPGESPFFCTGRIFWLDYECQIEEVTKTLDPGGRRTIKVTVTANGDPIEGETVSLDVFNGPNSGSIDSGVTGPDGTVILEYLSLGDKGLDSFIVSGTSSDTSEEFMCSGFTTWGVPPTNDECDEATSITVCPFIEEIDVEFAIASLSAPRAACTFAAEQRTVWYNFKNETSDPEIAIVSTTGSTYDTILTVFKVIGKQECGADNLMVVTCNDDVDSSFSSHSQVQFEAEPGVIYKIRVGEKPSFGTPPSEYTLKLTADCGYKFDIRPDEFEPQRADVSSFSPVAELLKDKDPVEGVFVGFGVSGVNSFASGDDTTSEFGTAGFFYDPINTPGFDNVTATASLENGLTITATRQKEWFKIEGSFLSFDRICQPGTSTSITAMFVKITQDSFGGELITPLAGFPVKIEVTSGPNMGAMISGVTDENGEITLTYVGDPNAEGTDSIKAEEIVDGFGSKIEFTSSKDWLDIPENITCQTEQDITTATCDFSDRINVENLDNFATLFCKTGSISPVVWYGYENTGDTPVNVLVTTVFSSENADTVIELYKPGFDPDHCTVLRPIACADQSLNGELNAAEMKFIAEPGEFYKLAIGGFDGRNPGILGVDINCQPAEALCSVTPKESAVSLVDASAPHDKTFTVTVDGSPLADTEVNYTVDGPNRIFAAQSIMTDSSGQVTITLPVPSTTGTDIVTLYGTVMIGGEEVRFSCTARQEWFKVECNIEPLTAVNQIDTNHSVKATVLVNGAPTPGVVVNFIADDESGANVNSQMATTGPDGSVEFVYTSSDFGTHDLKVSGLYKGKEFECTAETRWVKLDCVLVPLSANKKPGDKHTVSAIYTLDDQPVEDLDVTFSVLAGPSSKLPASRKRTDSLGAVDFTYTNLRDKGVDQLEAKATVLGFDLRCTAEVTWSDKPTCDFAPATQTLPQNGTALVIVTLMDSLGMPAANVPVTFTVVAGPNVGFAGVFNTDASGQAVINYLSSGIGTDDISATAFVDGVGVSCGGEVVWIVPSEDFKDMWMLF